ncbi:lysophospholipid acyltransferase family protein [Actinoplanes sp. NPDC051633]|uniref:lysophospholipid acyltransferase family protein n=1 Tax=Actinoplanes sp. NPDC051633 TaxID=3155670 RepID=UPI003425F9D7
MARREYGFWQWLAVGLVLPVMKVMTKPSWRGQEHLPPGRMILAPNHVSHFDPLVLAHFIYAADRWPRYLAKASLWKIPVMGPFLRKLQQIPVERGSVEAARSLDTLVSALDQGGVVVIYPEGTTTKEPDLWPMRGKTGAARLALLTGAPVIPVANWGADRIFDPRTSKFKFRWRTPVSVIAGPPVDLSKWQGETPSKQVLEEMTDTIMLATRDLLADIRGGQPPPLWSPPRRGNPPAVAE